MKRDYPCEDGNRRQSGSDTIQAARYRSSASVRYSPIHPAPLPLQVTRAALGSGNQPHQNSSLKDGATEGKKLQKSKFASDCSIQPYHTYMYTHAHTHTERERERKCENVKVCVPNLLCIDSAANRSHCSGQAVCPVLISSFFSPPPLPPCSFEE